MLPQHLAEAAGRVLTVLWKKMLELVVILIITRALTRAYLVSKTDFTLSNLRNDCVYSGRH
jgi:hypothetical protein